MHSSAEVIDIIKSLRKKKGLSVGELAKRVGVAKSTLSRYENQQREFPINELGKYADALNTSIEYLLGIPEQPTNLVEIKQEFVKIPVLGAIACGDPILAEENIIGYTYEVADTLPSGTVFALKAKGDSMEPTIPDGATVLIRQQSEVECGEIAAVRVNDDSEATLKRIKRQGETVFLMPDNPKHTPIIITEKNPATIIGKAISFKVTL
ncbi:LexA family transcriptional regulator [Rummeliibacillus sp. TYF-LIM-RU47]|uniref:LexA family protein n=1 Tax=Rummeliibacillus sp. TYF-LIM-RU47 TaxID=2608406 RepID=UPI00123926D9|nr:XRE family transcriptional regulator [Rummeliibacillus sp. TYF-LIM-RU47]